MENHNVTKGIVIYLFCRVIEHHFMMCICCQTQIDFRSADALACTVPVYKQVWVLDQPRSILELAAPQHPHTLAPTHPSIHSPYHPHTLASTVPITHTPQHPQSLASTVPSIHTLQHPQSLASTHSSIHTLQHPHTLVSTVHSIHSPQTEHTLDLTPQHSL